MSDRCHLRWVTYSFAISYDAITKGDKDPLKWY